MYSTIPAATASSALHVRSHRRGVIHALLLCAIAYALLAAVDLAMRPPFLDNHLHTGADYTFTAMGYPFTLATLWLFRNLGRMDAWGGRRLGRVGAVIVAVGLVGLTIALTASLVNADERALSPLYPLSSLLTFLGYILFAIAAARARVLPRWAGPALAVAWIVAGPIAPGRGLFLVQTVVCVLVAVALARKAASDHDA
jgi:hypothetical protein